MIEAGFREARPMCSLRIMILNAYVDIISDINQVDELFRMADL